MLIFIYEETHWTTVWRMDWSCRYSEILNGDHHTIPNNLIPENFGLLAFEWALEIMWLNSVSLQNMRELLQGEENSPGSDS